MRRGLKILAWLIGVLIAIPVLLLVLILIGANIDPGRRLLETLTASVTQNEVRIEGLSGRFPSALRVHRLTVADKAGTWLTVTEAALDWAPWQIIRGQVPIDRLTATSVTVARMPESSGSSSGGGGLPNLRVDLSHFSVDRLEIGPALAGAPIALAVESVGTLLTPESGEAHLAVTSLAPREGTARDHYTLQASVDSTHVHASVAIVEGAKGLIAGLAQLPDLGAIAVTASVDGPTNALATKAAIEAGQLRANLAGTVDVVTRAANLTVSANAAAMTPAPGIGWTSIQLNGTVHGPFLAPEAAGTLSVDSLTAAGAAIGAIRATISGAAGGETKLSASLNDLRLPGPSPDVLAGGPLTLDATARLQDANQPIRFALKHTLFSIEGTAEHMNQAHVHLTVPDLTPVAAVGGVDVHGQTSLDIDVKQSNDTIDLAAKGGVGITEAIQPVPALVGAAGMIDLAASLHGQDVTLGHLSLTGSAFNASAKGAFTGGQVTADWTVSLTNLGAVRPGVAGTLTGSGHVSGPLTSLSVVADVAGDVAGQGGHVDKASAHLTLDGLPDAPSARLTAGGTILDAPLAVELAAQRRDGAVHLVIDHATWKSLTAGGTLDLAAGEALPTGKITLAMPRLADLAPLVGRPVAGGIAAFVDATAAGTKINATVTGAAMPGTASVGKAVLDATVTDPGGNPAVDGSLTLDGIDASGVRASSRLTAKGPRDKVALTLDASSANVAGQSASVQGAAMLNATGKTLSLASFRAAWGSETVRLLSPAKIGFAQGVTVDKLGLGIRQGELTIAGRLADTLDARATLTNLPADIIAVVMPAYAADGTIAGEARLTGNPARPQGTIRITAFGLRSRTGPGRALPAANITMAANLAGASARLDGRLTAGTSNVTLTGVVPSDFAGPVDLRVGGGVDLALVSPLLQAQGMDARGRIDLALGVGGTVAKPRASGTVRLSGGDFQSIAQGVHVSAIGAVIRADGDTVRIEQFEAKAGLGTISASGTIGLTGNRLVDLTLRANNARLLASDLVTALADANLTIRGPLGVVPGSSLTLAGTISARQADIRVPEKLPPTIAVLAVREAGKPRPKAPPPTPMPEIALNLTLDAPARIYIRGRGLDVELGGQVGFGGTAAQLVPRGGLHLRRGTVSLAGKSLDLTEGTIDFSGGGLADPQLKLVATSTSATLTSTLTVSGDVRNPKIVLSSVPDLPQDEILSQLLFNTTKSRLNAFQLAQIASALASMSGVGSPLGDPLEGLRSKLGLDQLSVGSDASGGATLQAGRYVARGVRVGVAQGMGGNTQATVQVDITKGLKLETTAGTASSADTAAGGTNGASVGLKYQFEY